MNRSRTLFPMGYFLAFHTFGTWLPGDDRAWNRRDGGPRSLPPSRPLRAKCFEKLNHAPVLFDGSQIEAVHRAIIETCAQASWPLHALVVETAHVHVVVSAPRAPEGVVQYLKAWATRALRRRGEYLARPVWSEHGSTRYLHTYASIEGAIEYVLDPHHTPSGEVEPSER